MKALLSLLLITLPVIGTNYYVRSDGTATKVNAIGPAGTQAACMSMATQNASTFSAGDTIFICSNGGEYRVPMTVVSSGSAGNPIVYSNVAGQTPTIKADSLFNRSIEKWTKSTNGTNEYYLTRTAGTQVISTAPTNVYLDSIYMLKNATLGTLLDHQWGWGDNDGLGFNTIYIRDSHGDPDTNSVQIEFTIGAQAIYATGKSYVTLIGLRAMHGQNYGLRLISACSNITLKNCMISETHGNTIEGTGYNFYNCTFKNASSSNGHMWQTGAATGPCRANYYYCIFDYTYNNVQGIVLTDSGTTKFFNCTFSGIGNNAIKNNHAKDTCRVYNCTFNGCAWYTDANVLNNNAGVMSYANCNVVPSGYGITSAVVSNVADSLGNIVVVSKFKKTKYRGYLSIAEDDYVPGAAAHTDWMHLADTANLYGYKIGYSLSRTDMISQADSTALRPYFNSGHSYYSHTRDHADLADSNALTIRYVGTGSACAMTIRNDSLLTTVTGGPGGENLSLSLLASANLRLNNTGIGGGNLVGAIDGLSAYTSTLSSAYQYYCQSYMIDTMTGVDIKSGVYTIKFNRTKFFKREMDSSKIDLQNKFGGVCTTLVYPNGTNSLLSRDSTRTCGFLLGRAVDVGQAFANQPNYINQYNVITRAPLSVMDTTTDEGIRKGCIALLDRLSAAGIFQGLLTHGETSLSRARWGKILRNINTNASAYRFDIVTLNKFTNIMRTNGFLISTTDTSYQLRQLDSANYDIQAGSGLINIGDTVPLKGIANLRDMAGRSITDASGNLLVAKLDIGAYEFVPDTLARYYGSRTVGSTSISQPCSTLSKMVGDSVKVYFQYKPVAGSWASADSTAWTTVVLKDTLVASGLSSGTKYYTRLRAITTDKYGHIDTITSDSSTTSASDGAHVSTNLPDSLYMISTGPSIGSIYGTKTVAGTYVVTVRAWNASGTRDNTIKIGVASAQNGALTKVYKNDAYRSQVWQRSRLARRAIK